MAYILTTVALLLSVGVHGGVRRPVPEFDIDLGTVPEKRFAEVNQHFNASIHRFYYKYLDSLSAHFALKQLAKLRGPENEELQGEIRGVAEATNLPEYGVQAIQMLYELQTVMVPMVNFSSPWTWRGPGCTGILALNKADGMVYHARNLDFMPAEYMQEMTYVGTFKRDGQEVFRAHMVAGYSFPLTAMRKGPNGYSVEINTRYADHVGGNLRMFMNLFHYKVQFSGWTKRKMLENVAEYEAAVDVMSTTQYISPEYNVIGGVRKGTILARNPEGLAYQMTLGQPNFEQRDDYIIITNFDFVYHDFKERLDWTGGKGMGHPRRIAAQRLLNDTAVLTPEVLFSVIDDFEVAASDTIFQAIMNVETGLWNASLPACTDCGGEESQSVLIV